MKIQPFFHIFVYCTVINFASTVYADSIPLSVGGAWEQNPNNSDLVPNAFMTDYWTFESDVDVYLYVTDFYTSGDSFRVFDTFNDNPMQVLGKTPSVVDYFTEEVSFTDDNGVEQSTFLVSSQFFEEDPELAFGSEYFSSGKWLLEAGLHRIDIQVLTIPPLYDRSTGLITYSNLFSSSEVAVRVAPVPEPATLLLFGSGLVGIVGARFRKKKNH